jgi:hypothetical protein
MRHEMNILRLKIKPLKIQSNLRQLNAVFSAVFFKSLGSDKHTGKDNL